MEELFLHCNMNGLLRNISESLGRVEFGEGFSIEKIDLHFSF